MGWEKIKWFNLRGSKLSGIAIFQTFWGTKAGKKKSKVESRRNKFWLEISGGLKNQDATVE